MGLPPQTNPFILLLVCRLCPTPNLRGPMRPSSWKVTTPCAEIKGSPRRRIRIHRLINQVVDGLQTICQISNPKINTVARRRYSRMLQPCEQKNWRQKKKKQLPKLVGLVVDIVGLRLRHVGFRPHYPNGCVALECFFIYTPYFVSPFCNNIKLYKFSLQYGYMFGLSYPNHRHMSF